MACRFLPGNVTRDQTTLFMVVFRRTNRPWRRSTICYRTTCDMSSRSNGKASLDYFRHWESWDNVPRPAIDGTRPEYRIRRFQIPRVPELQRRNGTRHARNGCPLYCEEPIYMRLPR